MDEKLLERVETLIKALENSNKYPSRSSDIGLLVGSLSKAQGSYKKLIPNEYTSAGKYANLEAILAAVKDALATNGLGFYQHLELLDEGTGAALLQTIVGHESGQFISSTARIFSEKTTREFGTKLDDHKRIHALMILGIAPTENDPINYGNNGTEEEEKLMVDELRNPNSVKNLDPNSVVSKTEYNEILIAIGDHEDLAKRIMSIYKINTLADIPKAVYHDVLARIRRVRRTAEEYENRKK